MSKYPQPCLQYHPKPVQLLPSPTSLLPKLCHLWTTVPASTWPACSGSSPPTPTATYFILHLQDQESASDFKSEILAFPAEKPSRASPHTQSTTQSPPSLPCQGGPTPGSMGSLRPHPCLPLQSRSSEPSPVVVLEHPTPTPCIQSLTSASLLTCPFSGKAPSTPSKIASVVTSSLTPLYLLLTAFIATGRYITYLGSTLSILSPGI